jgi:integrase
VDENHIRLNPLKKIKFKRFDNPRRPRVVLSVDEIKLVLENAKNFDSRTLYPYLCGLAHTGARRSEILNLQREDIDFGTGLVHLRHTKNGHPRFVRMSPQLQEVLKEKLASHDHPWLFENDHGQPVHRAELARLIDKFNAFFPMEKEWTCHSLRHSFAYNFLKGGGEMYQLQAVLGHRGIQVTVDLYGQLKSQDIENPSPYKF